MAHPKQNTNCLMKGLRNIPIFSIRTAYLEAKVRISDLMDKKEDS
jgi:hypothetical protein